MPYKTGGTITRYFVTVKPRGNMPYLINAMAGVAILCFLIAVYIIAKGEIINKKAKNINDKWKKTHQGGGF
ncbi:hypothetical protein C7967_1156 [Thalassospira sp. 11-3]|nr:hypothetical protein C7967_1156 [Thalassospira sp. 11-3]